MQAVEDSKTFLFPKKAIVWKSWRGKNDKYQINIRQLLNVKAFKVAWNFSSNFISKYCAALRKFCRDLCKDAILKISEVILNLFFTYIFCEVFVRFPYLMTQQLTLGWLLILTIDRCENSLNCRLSPLSLSHPMYLEDVIPRVRVPERL